MEETTENYEEYFSQEQLNAAELEIYRAAGLTKQDQHQNTVVDMVAMKERTFQAVTSRVAKTRAEMAVKSVTQGELQAAVFPGSPGSDPKHIVSELSPLEQALRTRLRRAPWNLTNPSRKGNIQSRLGKEGRTEVLIRTKVQRGVDEIVGVFITDDPDLIMQESVHPVIEKLLGAAREVRLYNELIIEGRHPELMPQVSKMLDNAKKLVTAELTRSSAGTAPALGTGTTQAPGSPAAG